MNDPTDHPRYTADPGLACTAMADGVNHTCRCVYRAAVCDGHNHLCMCGTSWWANPRCDCNIPREKESMATPVSITLNATQGEFQVEVSIHSEVTVGPGSVASAQLKRAAKAMAVLLGNDYGDDTDDPDF